MEYFDAWDTDSRDEIPRVFIALPANMESEAFSAGYLEKYYLRK